MGRLKARKPALPRRPPALPLSPQVLEEMDRHRAAIIPEFEAALRRYAPPEWKAYYRYVLAYLTDPARSHVPEAEGVVYISARFDLPLCARVAALWDRLCAAARATGYRVTLSMAEDIGPDLREMAVNVFGLLVVDLVIEASGDTHVSGVTRALAGHALERIACRGVVLLFRLGDGSEDALTTLEWGEPRHPRYLHVVIQEGQPPALSWMTRETYSAAQMDIARSTAGRASHTGGADA